MNQWYVRKYALLPMMIDMSTTVKDQEILRMNDNVKSENFHGIGGKCLIKCSLGCSTSTTMKEAGPANAGHQTTDILPARRSIEAQ